MASIQESALAYEPPQTKTISDLPMFDKNMELKEFTGEDKDGKVFAYEYVEDKEGVKYRFPISVKKKLKEYLKEYPDQKLFKVTKEGSGMNTEYTLLPVFTDA